MELTRILQTKKVFLHFNVDIVLVVVLKEYRQVPIVRYFQFYPLQVPPNRQVASIGIGRQVDR